MGSEAIGVERRRLPFTLIENIVLEDQELGPVDVLVYLALAKHADAEGTCWPSMATISRIARVGRSKAFEAVKHLEARGYIRRTARFRPDGGITSNVYQLLQMKVEASVQHVDGPCPPGERPPVHRAYTNYTQSEQDPTKGGVSSRAPQPSRQVPTPLSASRPEDQVLEELADVPGLAHDRRFREGARQLLAQGKTPGELVLAVRTAAEDPQECGGLSFIADRFPRWVRKAREHERQERQSQEQEAAKSDRLERERRAAEEQARIRAEQDSEEGRQLVEAATAQLPWRRVRG